jgi:GT2 family glycosyltransferase
MVGSTLRYYNDPNLLQAMGGARMDPVTTSFSCIGIGEPFSAVPTDPSAVEYQMAYVVGASMLVSTDFVREIGYMQEDYFLYFEEPDWAWRSRHRFRLGYAPGSVVYHKVGASSAQVASLYSLNLICRNRIRFVARFMPDRLVQTKRHMYRQILGRASRLRFREALVMARALRDARQLSSSVVPVDQS